MNRINKGDEVYTIGHLSDPHLTLPRIDRLGDLAGKRLLGYLSWLKRRRVRHQRVVLDQVVADMQARAPAHLLVSGDLTHLGLTGEFEQALGWLESLGAARDVSVVLGNHERISDDRHWQAVSLWQSYLAGDDAGVQSPTVCVRNHVAIIGVNTSVSSPLLLATGRVGEQQRAALAECLTQQQARFRVVVMHHSPLPDGHIWRKRLVDAGAIMDVLRDVGAELVVHGHGHHTRLDMIEGAHGPICVICAPSASLVGEGKAGWNAYEITQSDGVWDLAVELRRYRSGTPHMATRAREHFAWDRRG